MADIWFSVHSLHPQDSKLDRRLDLLENLLESLDFKIRNLHNTLVSQAAHATSISPVMFTTIQQLRDMIENECSRLDPLPAKIRSSIDTNMSELQERIEELQDDVQEAKNAESPDTDDMDFIASDTESSDPDYTPSPDHQEDDDEEFSRSPLYPERKRR